jgi:uncharacterized membrane protein YjgN (DUF898 family)
LDIGFFLAMWKIGIELIMAAIFVFIFRWLTFATNILLLNADFFPEPGKIAIEIFLAILTAWFYFPMAFIRLYRYFVEHTKSNIVDGNQITMGYVGDQLADFKYMWKQILLTVITLGFYYPWAFSRIASRVLTQTYMSVDLAVVHEK